MFYKGLPASLIQRNDQCTTKWSLKVKRRRQEFCMAKQVRPRSELGHSVIRVTFRRSIQQNQGILNHEFHRLPTERGDYRMKGLFNEF